MRQAGSLHNKDPFLNNIASNLGRTRRTEGVVRPDWKVQPQHAIYQGLGKSELLEIFKEHCKNIHTDYYEANQENVKKKLKEAAASFGGGPVITWNDPRFEEYGLSDLLYKEWPEENIQVHKWNSALGEENIHIAEKANLGITFSDITLAESGTIVLFSGEGKGRSVSFLPEAYISIVPLSSLVPRMTQAGQKIHQMIEDGETISSCINFITGPSNSADIEMNLVVGVHGPVKAAYIVVMDK
ncbi:LutC/YkgG family protein [Metabacillus sp. RGM 3146]|uniref:LutC/YkgG family protein n=1 Tax=Metabacillus sp. RGM 3146 TaxID=3401092 RepID=UPI003B9D0891